MLDNARVVFALRRTVLGLLALAAVLCVIPEIASATGGDRPNLMLPPIHDSTPRFVEVPQVVEVIQGKVDSVTIRASDPQGTIPQLYVDVFPPESEFADLGDGSGVLTLHPTSNLVGEYSVRVIATDGEHADSAIFTVRYRRPNLHPPKWETVPESLAVLEGTSGYSRVVATDGDGTSPQLTAIGLPATATFVDFGDGTGTIRYSPVAGNEERSSVRLVATDGTRADTAVVTLIVVPYQGQPFAHWVYVPDTLEAVFGDEISVTVLAIGAGGFPPRLYAEDIPINASFADLGEGRGSLRFSPGPSQFGYFSVRLIVTTGSLSDTATVVLVAGAGQNWPPVWGPLPDSVTIRADATLDLDVSVTDPDGPPPTVTVLWLPPNGTFLDNKDGTGHLHFAPSLNQIGQFIVGFLAFDGNVTTEVRLRIRVVPAVNRAPVWVDLPERIWIFAERTSVIDLLANDPDHDSLGMRILAAPYNTGLVDRGDGTGQFTFTPSAAQTGIYTVRLVVQDSSLADTASIVVVVSLAQNRSPIWLTDPSVVYALPGTSHQRLLAAVDPDSTIPTFKILDFVGFVTVLDHGNGTAHLTIAPFASDVGEYSITVGATDGTNTSTQTLTIVVPELGEGTPDSLSDSLGSSFYTTLVKSLDVVGLADQLQVHDLDGNGLDEIVFRQTAGNGDQTLEIWEPAAESLWALPMPPGAFQGYSFRSGVEFAEPVLWMSDGRIMSLNINKDAWVQIGQSPPGTLRFAWIPRGENAGGLLFLQARSSSSSLDHWGCVYSSHNKWGEGLLVAAGIDSLIWPILGRLSYDQSMHTEVVPLINGPRVDGVLCPAETYESVLKGGYCMPGQAFGGFYGHRVILADDDAPRTAVTHYSFQPYDFYFPPSALPDSRQFGVGLGRLSTGLHEREFEYAFVNPNYSLRVIRISESTVAEISSPVLSIAQFKHGGIVSVDPDETELMFLTDANRVAHAFSIPEATYEGLISLPRAEPFATGAAIVSDRKDLIYARREIEVFQVRRVDPSESHRTIRVPEDFERIQYAIDAAKNGDTVLVGPGEYFENVMFRGKRIVVQSTAGAESTWLRPMRPIAGLSFTLGESPSTVLSGFRVYGTNCTPVVLIRNYAGATLVGCEFFDYSGTSRVIECDGGNVSITGNHFSRNSGQACVSVLRGSVDLIRNVFDSNSSKLAIENYVSECVITNNTLAWNRGGILDNNGYASVRNNIVANGSLTGISRRSQSVPPSQEFMDYNLVWSNNPDYAYGASAGDNDLAEPPQFVDAPAGDYRLLSTSPCIDAGDPDPQFNDPDGSRNDVGAIPYGSLSHSSGDVAGEEESILELVRLIDRAYMSSPDTVTRPESDYSHRAQIRRAIDRLFGNTAGSRLMD